MSLATFGSLKKWSVGVIPLFMAAHSLPVMAADDEGLMLEEIVVTATRQASGSQSTPLALTAMSGEDLDKQGVNSLIDLSKMAPSLFVQDGISAASPRFSLRGISSADLNFNGSTPVALYLDDVYQTSTYGISTQLFDVGRVEVLRGPQGTLFGKNTTGGAISYFSVEPSDTSEGYASFHLGFGNQTERAIEGAFNAPLSDTLAMRISVKSETKGDYVQDFFNSTEYGHHKADAIRAQLKWTPSDETSVNLALMANSGGGTAQILHVQMLPNVCDPSVNENRGSAFYFCTGAVFEPFPPPPLVVVGTLNPVAPQTPDFAGLTPGVPNDEDYDSQGVTLRVNQKLGEMNLSSISHYKRGEFFLMQDADGAPGDWLILSTRLRSKQIGQELRLATDPAQPLSAVFGAYYQHDDLHDADSFSSVTGPAVANYNQQFWFNNKTTTYALFSSVTYKITDALSVVGGVRKSDERKKTSGNVGYYYLGNTDWTVGTVLPTSGDMTGANANVLLGQSIKATPFTWDGTVNFKPLEDTLLFARVAKSFRSGGFNQPTFINPSGFGPPPSTQPVFQPEYIVSYEVGVKSEWLNNSLRTNATVFHYKFTDQQVQLFNGGIPITENAGESKVDGVELEVKALPIRALELSASASYTKARYKHYETVILDNDGNENDVELAGRLLPQAPKVTATAGVAYTFDVTDNYGLRASTDWQYRSEVFFTPNNDPNVRSAPLTTGSVRLELAPQEGKGVSVGAFVDNVTNKKPVTYGFGLPPVENAVVYGTGRKYGVEMKYGW